MNVMNKFLASPIKKVALAHFKKGKMLQVRTSSQEQVFYTLGGKYEPGEDDYACIKREVKEEVNCEVIEKSVKFLKEFEDENDEGGVLNIRLYKGELIGEPKPSSEIVEIGWFDSNSDPKNLSLIAKRTIFPWLKMHGYIN